MRVHYEVDGKRATAVCLTTRYPRVYEVRVGDGPLLGYAERSLLGRTEAYSGKAAPDMVGSQHLGSFVNMRQAIECVMRAASSEVPE